MGSVNEPAQGRATGGICFALSLTHKQQSLIKTSGSEFSTCCSWWDAKHSDCGFTWWRVGCLSSSSRHTARRWARRAPGRGSGWTAKSLPHAGRINWRWSVLENGQKRKEPIKTPKQLCPSLQRACAGHKHAPWGWGARLLKGKVRGGHKELYLRPTLGLGGNIDNCELGFLSVRCAFILLPTLEIISWINPLCRVERTKRTLFPITSQDWSSSKKKKSHAQPHIVWT